MSLGGYVSALARAEWEANAITGEGDFSGCAPMVTRVLQGHVGVYEGPMPKKVFGSECADGGLKVETILQEAQRLVHGDRGAAYGHPREDFTRTGRMWAAILNVPHVTPEQVGLCMAAMKISRQCNKPKRDNMTDLAGYAETVQMCIDASEIK